MAAEDTQIASSIHADLPEGHPFASGDRYLVSSPDRGGTDQPRPSHDGRSVYPTEFLYLVEGEPTFLARLPTIDPSRNYLPVKLRAFPNEK